MTFDELYSLFIKHKTIVTDSRKISTNSIFWALKGDNFDANDFVEECLDKGAVAAVSGREDLKNNPKVFFVEDTLQALQDFSRFHRQKLACKIIGITGTNGKTTTKELVTEVLSEKYRVKSTIGNLNNHIGVPLTLLSFDENTELGIVEMGANHAGEIEFLCRLAEPDFGIVTNVGKAHLEGFGNFETIVETKTALYRAVQKRKGTVFVNVEDNILLNHAKNISHRTYGEKPEADFKVLFENSALFSEIEIQKTGTKIASNLVGRYNCVNIAAAACIGDFFGIEHQKIKNALANYFPSNNRSQLIKTSRNQVILDAYNANPSSMQVAVENFQLLDSTDKIAVLGDMFELGSEEDKEHKSLIEKVLNLQFQKVLFTGERFFRFKAEFQTGKNAHFFVNTQNLKDFLSENLFENKLILVKGSRGMKMETIVDFL